MLEDVRDRQSPLAASNFYQDADRPLHQIRAMLVDDDDDYREAAVAELQYLGFDVEACSGADDMLAVLDHKNWHGDVIILDWRLPTGPAVGLMPELLVRGIKTPVIFLTGSPSVAAELAALDRGAVDFVDKARGIPVLAKRLQMIVRTSGKASRARLDAHALVEAGKLALRPDIGRAYWGGVDVDLTLTEFKIVYMLAAHVDEYLTYRAVYDCVRHAGFVAGYGEDGFRTNVRSSIRRIRNKFRKLDGEFDEIENYPSFGYRWRSAGAQARAVSLDRSVDAEAVATT